MNAELPQQWRPAMRSDLGNSTAAVQVHTCLLKGVQPQSIIAATSLPNSPSMARLPAAETVHKQLALLSWHPTPTGCLLHAAHHAALSLEMVTTRQWRSLIVLHDARAYCEIAAIMVMSIFKYEHQMVFSPWLEAVRLCTSCLNPKL